MQFPSFYAECAYNDGKRDAAAGHCNSVGSFMRHGDPEPVGMHWYLKGWAKTGDDLFTDALGAPGALEWVMTHGGAA